MAVPLLEVTPKTENHRVAGYEVPNEDHPVIYRLTDAISSSDVDAIIWAAYRQVFAEQLILSAYRQNFLESQLRNRKISVADLIRGLAKSTVYRQEVVETNSNYRLVDITFKRLLGRASYNKDEQIAWSIVIATKGFDGFVDAIIDGEEYRSNFGDDIVPYQRRRFNEKPFNLVNPRYSDYWRNKQVQVSYQPVRAYRPGGLDPQIIRQAIPVGFQLMAKGMITGEVNYQRTIATVTSQIKTMAIPDTSRDIASPKPAVGRTEIALPYRYISSEPRV